MLYLSRAFCVAGVLLSPAMVAAQSGVPAAATVPQGTGTGTAPAVLNPSAVQEAIPAKADPLLDQVEEAIRVNGQRFLTANYHSPWQIFHGLVAYRRDFQVKVGDTKMSAIDWISTADARFDNLPWIMTSQHGAKFHPYTRPYAFEGHPSQSLALLSESYLPVTHEFRVGQQTVTIAQMLQNTMMEVNTREETTWVLWALINYLKVDATWTNQWGQAWSIEALVRNEIAAHTPTRPCGGNHNLFALSRARDKYLRTGRPLRGVWLEADQKVRQYAEIARSMQNADGSFSSNFYKGPGFEQDMNKRFNSTGHTMEFLAVGLPQERLQEPWVRNAVNVLSRELIQHRKASVDCGPLYHSLNALIIYRDRVRGTPTDVASRGDVPAIVHPLARVVEAAPVATLAPVPVPAAVTATPPVTIPEPKMVPSNTGDRSSLSAKPVATTAPAPSAPVSAQSVMKPRTPDVDQTAPRLPSDTVNHPVTPLRGPVSALDILNR